MFGGPMLNNQRCPSLWGNGPDPQHHHTFPNRNEDFLFENTTARMKISN